MNLTNLALDIILMLIPIGILSMKKHYIWAGVCAALCIFTGLVDGVDAIGGMAILLIPVALIVLLVSYMNSKKAKKEQERNVITTNVVQQQNIKAGTTIKAVLNTYPETEAVFKKYNMGCSACAAAAFESIKDGCLVHGVDVERFLNELNAVLEDKQSKNEEKITSENIQKEREATEKKMQKNDNISNKGNLLPEDYWDKALVLMEEDNKSEAIKYFTLAADGGHLMSKQTLGAMYLKGDGTAKNIEKGEKYLKGAADGGLVTAQLAYASLLANGVGVRQNLSAAGDYMEKAALNGDARAMLAIAGAYATGMYGKSVAYDVAESWAKKAVDAGAKAAGEKLLMDIAAERRENEGSVAGTSDHQPSENKNAWMVKAFANLIKKGEIDVANGGYTMNGRPMDGMTLYDAFASVRLRFSRDMAEEEVENVNPSTRYIRYERLPKDFNNMGAYGIYEDMYEVSRMEFYTLLMQYLP